jgi:putative oxidoreductase
MNIIKQILSSDSNWSGIPLRLSLGLMMFPHGAQKMLGIFGGHGFHGTMQFLTGLGFPWILAFAAILVEFFAPIFLILGFGTKIAAGLIFVVMLVAMTIHIPNGFFMNWYGVQQGEGIEMFLLIFGLAIALMIQGGGKASLDSRIA